jgi:hypothetical protein
MRVTIGTICRSRAAVRVGYEARKRTMIQHVWQTVAVLMLGMAAPAAWAQVEGRLPPAPGMELPAPAASMDATGLPVPMITSCPVDTGSGCCADHCSACGPSLYASFDFLMARPHFSEAIAFAQVNAVSGRVDARELQFGYDPSFRLRLGTWLDGTSAGFRGTYWHFEGDTQADGRPSGTTIIVDPFGNVAAAPGSLLQTEAEVQMNVYDLDFVSLHDWDGGCTTLAWSAGARIADVDQSYDALTTVAGVPVSFGDFSADFIGAGPRIGLEATHRRSPCSPLSLMASAHGSLLVGEYDVSSSNTSPFIVGEQHESLTRTIPVMEMELGAKWQAGERWNVSAGWMFQAWFDLGTSGGRFEPPVTDPLLGGVDPLFTGADDANIMSFDGFFLRAEMGF